MQNKFGTPPSRPPLKPKQSTSGWLIILSVLQGLTLLLVGGLFVLELIGSGNGAPQKPGQSSASDSTVTPGIPIPTEEQKPTEEPAPIAPPKSFTFTTKNLAVEFTQPAEIKFDTNMDLASIRFELLKADETSFPDEQSGLQPGENKVTVPASKFVGDFTIRAVDVDKDNSVLGETSFTVQYPVQPGLDNLLEIRPHIKIGEQYILLPGISTIGIKDSTWQIDAGSLDTNIARVDDGGVIRMNGDKPDTTDVEEDFNRTLLSLEIPIIMPGVLDNAGNPYKYTVSVPLLAQNSLPVETKGALLNYDVFAGKFPDDKTDQEVLDNIANFVTKNSIFSIREFEFGNPAKKYSVVMIVGKINKTTFDGMDEFKKDVAGTFQDSLVPFLFPEKEKIKDENNRVVRTMDGQGAASVRNGVSGAKFYIIGELDNSYQIVLFGVIGQ